MGSSASMSSSSSTSVTTAAGAKGLCWTGKLCLAWEETPGRLEEDRLDPADLTQLVIELKRGDSHHAGGGLDVSEGTDIYNDAIEHVWVYRHALYRWQVTASVLHHAFVVFRTRRGVWVSFEKNSEGVFVQLDSRIDGVRDFYKFQQRPPAYCSHYARGAATVGQLLGFLDDNQELFNTYRVSYANNCKGFADRLFAFCTR